MKPSYIPPEIKTATIVFSAVINESFGEQPGEWASAINFNAQ